MIIYICIGGIGKVVRERLYELSEHAVELQRSLFSDDFRIFVGDLGNEVSDDALLRAFSKYPSLLKARVIRDKKTKKTKGYGFVSFKEPQDYLKAMREMNG